MLKIGKYLLVGKIGRSKDGIAIAGRWGWKSYPVCTIILTPFFSFMIHW
jgi:hypothetical protein